MTTKMLDAVSEIDICPCAKLQSNPFSSFGGDASRTDGQTANLMLSISMREITQKKAVTLTTMSAGLGLLALLFDGISCFPFRIMMLFKWSAQRKTQLTYDLQFPSSSGRKVGLIISVSLCSHDQRMWRRRRDILKA